MLRRNVTLRLSPLQLTWTAALFFSSVGNLVLWRTLWKHLEIIDFHGFLFCVSIPILLFSLLNLLLTPAIILPHLGKPILIALIVISAGCTHFMYHYSVLIDRSMVQNLFETNYAELTSYFSTSLLATFVLIGVIPACAIAKIHLKNNDHGWQTALIGIANILTTLLVLLIIIMAFYKDYASLLRNHREIRHQVLPLSFIHNTNSYLKRKYRSQSQNIRSVALDASRQATEKGRRSKLLVLVVGETARAQNFQVNGYGRPTNPVLSQRPDLITFKHVSSCGTSTAISLPCMFSRMTRQKFDEVIAATEENLLDILKRSGIDILWRNNNNGGCKGVCARIPTQDMPTLKVDGLCVNKDGTCYDEVLLHQLSTHIDAMQDDALIVLHQIGSHGPTYFERYPQKAHFFSPTCDSNQIQKCSNEALINTYDNTIIYTDYMLGKTIDMLERQAVERDVAMIYISDHGESLGESGIYLHGTPYVLAPQQQTQVPLLMWISDSWAQNARMSTECLRQNAANRSYSHDNLYHSILGLFDVQTNIYQAPLDVFADCRPCPHG